MSVPVGPSGFERAPQSAGGSTAQDIDLGMAEGRLSRLNQAAAGLLEPLLREGDQSSLAVDLASAVQQCAAVANSLGLRGPDYLSALLVPFLQGPAGRDFIALDRDAFERWVGEIIGFFSGQLDLADVTGLVSQLDRWLGFAGVPSQFVALIGERLRSDLRQIREWLRLAESGRAAQSLRALQQIAAVDEIGSGEVGGVGGGGGEGGGGGGGSGGVGSGGAGGGEGDGEPATALSLSSVATQSSPQSASATAFQSASSAPSSASLPAVAPPSESPRRDVRNGPEPQARPDPQAPVEPPTDAASPVSVGDLWPLDVGDLPWGAPADVALDETAMLAEAARSLGEDLVPILLSLDAPPGQPTWAEFVDEYLSRLEHMANASEYIGAPVLSKLLAGLVAQLRHWLDDIGRFNEDSRRLLLMTPDTLADLFAGIDASSIDHLIFLLGDPGWPSPLPPSAQPSLRAALLALRVIASRQVAAPPTEIDEDDLSLAIPAEADHSVVDNLLRELPQLSGEFSESVDQLRRGDVHALDRAQRIAHTLKGSANTVGVRGIASLTHRLEDVLQLLSRDGLMPSPALSNQLADAADCLAEMCDAVAGIGPPPENAEAVLRAVIESTRALLRGDTVESQADESADVEVMPAAMAPGTSSPADPASSAPLAGAPVVAAPIPSVPVPSLPIASVPSASVPVVSAPVVSAPSASAPSASAPIPSAAMASDAPIVEPPTSVDVHPQIITPEVPVAPEQAETLTDPVVSESTLTDVDSLTSTLASAVAPAGGAVESTADTVGAGEAEATPVDEMLRVPAGVVTQLLDFANEAMIALAQMQERITVLGDTRASLRAGSERFQDLSMELERLVDVRGLALTGRSRQADFDALELDEYNDLHTVSRRFAEAGADHKLVDHQFDQELVALREQIAQLDRVQTDLREAALKTRMVTIDTMAGRLQRAVRQAARLSGKEVELSLFGTDTAIDSHLLQILIDPLMHMLRNAVDHGIELPDQRLRHHKPRLGRIELEFQRDGAELRIRCSDDGQGLDTDAIVARARATGLIDAAAAPTPAEAARLILLPGFSTREQATQLSGRGIGLDVVRERMRELRGRIDVWSEPRQGTTLSLAMPVRLAAVPVMILRSPHHVLAVSVRDIEQIVSSAGFQADASGRGRLSISDVDYPAVTLEALLGLPEGTLMAEAGVRVAMVVRDENAEPMAVIAPEPGQTRNVILRPLAAVMPVIPGVGGVAVLGDGAVAPILDLPELLSRREAPPQYASSLSSPTRAAAVCLIVDDSVSVRRSMELFLLDLGLQVDSASDGIDALAAVEKRRPDLVIADLEMPRMNGIELAGALRARPQTADVPLIMITSRYSDKHKQLALAAGADVFMTKPYTEDELAAHIQRCLYRGTTRDA